MTKRGALAAALLATTALWPVAAAAEPISIGAFFAGIGALGAGAPISLAAGSIGFGIAGGTAAVVAGAAQLALTVGSVALQVALASRRPASEQAAVARTVTRGEPGPGIHAAGRVLVGGKILPPAGASGFLNYFITLHCFGPLDGVEDWFINDIKSVVEDDTDVLSQPYIVPQPAGTQIAPFVASATYMKLAVKNGDGTETAWPDMLSTFPQRWTANHRGRGIVQTQMRATSPGRASEYFGRLYGTSPIPLVKFVGRVGSFYDPRTETSAWSENAALIALHYLRRLPDWSDDARINFELMSDAADWCDALVSRRGGGTEPRARLSVQFEGSVTMDIVREMLRCAGMEALYDDQGRIYFKGIDDYPSAEFTFPWSHVLDWQSLGGPEAVDRPNVARIEHHSEVAGYRVAEVPGLVPSLDGTVSGAAWASVADEISRFGRRETLLSYPYSPSTTQAQRNGRRDFLTARADTWSLTTTIAGQLLKVGGVYDIEIDRIGETGEADIRLTRVRVLANDMDLINRTCTLVVQEIPTALATAFNPATDAVDGPASAPVGEFTTSLPAPSAAPTFTTVQYPGGAYETRALFPAPAILGDGECFWRTFDASGYPNPERVLTTRWRNTATNQYVAWTPALNLIGEKVAVAARIIDANGSLSNFSAVATLDPVATDNTAPGAPTLSGSYNDVDGQFECSIEVPGSLSAVSLIFETSLDGTLWSSAGVAQNVRPYDSTTANVIVSVSAGQTVQLRARLLTTNGTSSPASSILSYTAPE